MPCDCGVKSLISCEISFYKYGLVTNVTWHHNLASFFFFFFLFFVVTQIKIQNDRNVIDNVSWNAYVQQRKKHFEWRRGGPDLIRATSFSERTRFPYGRSWCNKWAVFHARSRKNAAVIAVAVVSNKTRYRIYLRVVSTTRAQNIEARDTFMIFPIPRHANHCCITHNLCYVQFVKTKGKVTHRQVVS